jgi:type IV secretory pathway TrbL component
VRTYPDEARRPRTIAEIIADALALLHQDIAEYGFAGLIGAIGAAFLALILSTAGDLAGKALIAPAVFIVTLVTYANTCAAIRRVQDNLEPDAIRAFFAVLARLDEAHPLITGAYS